MKRLLTLALAASIATPAAAQQIPVQHVADDAKVIDRVAQAAKRDLPQDLLKRILMEDIELLRGKRSDGTYEYATYEKFEASRIDSSFSVQPKADALQGFQMKGAFVYRLIIDVPSRRMLVTKNRRVYIDHVELEYVTMSSSAPQPQSIKVEAWMEPGETRNIDFPEVARQGSARVLAKADDKAGYSNIVLTLLTARVVDNADSPYADAVASAKAMLRAIDNNDIPSIRAMATRMHDRLSSAPAVQSVDVIAPVAVTQTTTPAQPMAANSDLYAELQAVEDLLTGSDAEKRQGLDRLHQLVRKLRPR